MTIPEYRPVSGELYDVYELAIVRRQSLRLGWHGPRGQDRVESVQPLDLRTRRRAEYILFEDSLGRHRLARLDRIVGVNALDRPRG